MDLGLEVTPISVGVQQFRERLADNVRRAAAGQRFVVTNHGRPVAGLVSVADLESLEGQAELPKRPKPGRK